MKSCQHFNGNLFPLKCWQKKKSPKKINKWGVAKTPNLTNQRKTFIWHIIQTNLVTLTVKQYDIMFPF